MTRTDRPPRDDSDGPTVPAAPSSARPPAPVPERLGSHRILSVLGRGGMGVVYLARDERLGRTVALKVMAEDLAADASVRARFEREARVLAAVRHAHVATLHGLEEDEGVLYLVLEHLDGSSLSALLSQGALELERALDVAAQVASGLAAAHARGVIHRDLKPGNVHSTAAGDWKVLDFGLARPMRLSSESLAVTAAGLVLGTPAYMSPEQVLGAELDETVDLWALGCVLYECLTGARAFTGRSVGEVERAILGAEPDWSRLPAGLPPSVEGLLRSCLDKEPSRRWRSAEEARRVLLGESELRVPLARSGARGGPGALPRRLTSFVGRESERARIARELERAPLVTLTGPGGSGKTRLALAVAEDLGASPRFGEPPVFVDLAPVAAERLVAPAVAAALGLREEAGRDREEQLLAALAESRRLLLLDNCEHLVRECSRLVGRIVEGCPGVAVLATSREPLGLPGERVEAVAPLPVPGGEDSLESLAACGSVQLFCDRARAARPDFALDEQTAPLVALLCRRLDGIPLALELAAARLKVLAIEQVVERLRDRFRLLAGGSQAGVPRQQTLRAAIDWSHDQLGSAERALFRRLSVFVGGATLESAERACEGGEVELEEVLDLLARLADKSLLQVSVEAGEARYRFLESLRQYALEKLEAAGETELLRGRHLQAFSELARGAAEAFASRKDAAAWQDRLGRELENLRAALQWSRSGTQAAQGLRIAVDLGRFWDQGGHWREGLDTLASLLEASGPDAALPVRARAAEWIAWLQHRLGRSSEALETSDRAIALAREWGEPDALAGCLNDRGLMLRALGRPAEARPLHAEALQHFERAGDLTGQALTQASLGGLDWEAGELSSARRRHEASLHLRRQVGDASGQVSSLANLASVEMRQGELDRAREHLDQALELQRSLGGRNALAAILTNLGAVATARGELEAAERYLEESLSLFESLGAARMVVRARLNLGSLARLQGRPEKARTELERAHAESRAVQDPVGECEALLRLGSLALERSELEEAGALLAPARAIALRVGLGLHGAELVETLAELAAVRGRHVLAARLLGAARSRQEEGGGALPPQEARRRELLEARLREALGEERLGDELRAGGAWSLEAALKAAGD